MSFHFPLSIGLRYEARRPQFLPIVISCWCEACRTSVPRIEDHAQDQVLLLKCRYLFGLGSSQRRHLPGCRYRGEGCSVLPIWQHDLMTNYHTSSAWHDTSSAWHLQELCCCMRCTCFSVASSSSNIESKNPPIACR